MTDAPNPHAAAIGRFRRLSDQTAGKGMNCTVSGDEIRGILAALDTANAAREAAEVAAAAKPKRGKAPARSFDDDDVFTFARAVDDILHFRPEFWGGDADGEPLSVSLKAWGADQPVPNPVAWDAICGGI